MDDGAGVCVWNDIVLPINDWADEAFDGGFAFADVKVNFAAADDDDDVRASSAGGCGCGG